MKQKSILILSVVTLVALGVAALSLKRGSEAESVPETPHLFPELGARVNEVAEVHVEKADKSATLKLEGDGWVLSDRSGYPAQLKKVKELVVRVAALEIQEQKTARKENHAKLAVDWPHTGEASEDGEPALVTLKDKGGKELAALVLGKSEYGGRQPKYYARSLGSDQVYLCSAGGTLEVSPETSSWIDEKILALASDRVQDVTIEHHDGERLSIARSAANHTQFVLQDLPPGRSEKYAGVATGPAQALSSLTLEDVRAVGEVDFTVEPIARTRYRCVDGLQVELEIARFEDARWVKVAVHYEPPPEPAPDAAPAPEAGAEGAEAGQEPETPAETPGPDVRKEADELATRLGPWAFKVPDYKVETLTRHMADMLAESTVTSPAGDGGLEGLLDDMGQHENEEAVEGVEKPALPDDEEHPSPAPNQPAPEEKPQ